MARPDEMQGRKSVLAGADVLAAHLGPRRREPGEIEPCLRRFMAAVQEASIGVECA